MELTTWTQPDPGVVPPRVGDLLRSLPGPTAIEIPGEDRSRCRVLVTLSHGNEPSGLEALHRWLRSGRVPAVDLLFVLGSVEAARAEPMFYFRMLPGQRDLNRCFNPPYVGPSGELAAAMLERIHAAKPEAVIDLHNTSGSNPAFSVTIGDSPQLRALSSLFAAQMIVTDLRLGSLMEQDFGCPIVTIEAGGSQDDAAAGVCDAGFERFFHRADVFADPGEVTLLEHPYRLELQPHARIDFAEHALPGRDLTMRSDIERFNFAPVPPSEPLGWAEGLSCLRASTGRDTRDAREFFRVEDGRIYTRGVLRLFMATTRADIAASDCLFYFVRED
ncbi:MAG: succinylglutamate desuccinylase [Nannocystales bacterium]